MEEGERRIISFSFLQSPSSFFYSPFAVTTFIKAPALRTILLCPPPPSSSCCLIHTTLLPSPSLLFLLSWISVWLNSSVWSKGKKQLEGCIFLLAPLKVKTSWKKSERFYPEWKLWGLANMESLRHSSAAFGPFWGSHRERSWALLSWWWWSNIGMEGSVEKKGWKRKGHDCLKRT